MSQDKERNPQAATPANQDDKDTARELREAAKEAREAIKELREALKQARKDAQQDQPQVDNTLPGDLPPE